MCVQVRICLSFLFLHWLFHQKLLIFTIAFKLHSASSLCLLHVFYKHENILIVLVPLNVYIVKFYKFYQKTVNIMCMRDLQ